MRKITTKKVVAVAVAATLAFGSLASAMVGRSGDAKTIIDDPAYFYDFEGDNPLANKGTVEVADATVVGAGAVKKAGDNTYFDNASEAESNAANKGSNYLSLPGKIVETIHKSTDHAITVSMKIKTVADKYSIWSPVLVMDSTSNPQSWPVLAFEIRGTAAWNAAGYYNGDNVNNDTATAKYADNEWHTLTFTMTESKLTSYIDGDKLTETDVHIGDAAEGSVNGLFDNGDDFFAGANRVALGGNQPFDWADPDAQILYDDVAIFAKELTADEIKDFSNDNYIFKKDVKEEPTPTATVTPGGNEGENPSQNPSQNPGQSSSDNPTVTPTPTPVVPDTDVISSAKWWSFTGVSKDYAVNSDASVAVNVEVQKAAANGEIAFNAEVYNPGTDAKEDGYYFTTGSNIDAWSAELSKGVGKIDTVKGAATAPEVGHTYNITVVRKGDTMTVQYYDVTAKALYAKYTWTGNNMPADANLHIIAQMGTFKVTPADVMEIIDTTVKPSDNTTAKPSDNTTAKPSDNTTAKPSNGTGGTTVTGKVTKVTVKAANKKAGNTIYVKKGDKVTLKTTVTGTGTFTKDVTYKSSKTKVATVSAKGVVKAKKAGTAKITVTSKFDKTKKATITVKVSKKKVANKKLTLKVKKKTLKKGKTYTVAIKSMTKKTTDKVTYKTSKKKVATVDKYGVVTAKKKGKATITVKCGKKKATLKVTVK